MSKLLIVVHMDSEECDWVTESLSRMLADAPGVDPNATDSEKLEYLEQHVKLARLIKNLGVSQHIEESLARLAKYDEAASAMSENQEKTDG